MEVSVPTGRDTPKKGSRKHISSKRIFPQKGKSVGCITTPINNKKCDSYDDNNDGDLGDTSPARDMKKNSLQERKLIKLVNRSHDSSSDRNPRRCRETKEKTLNELILKRYIKRRKSFARKLYDIKKKDTQNCKKI
ncbi:hypothetical protein AK88_00257 [Plasmodium fragile]|uniref:Uncharacterized protein n=1 Tax=Plasmodium fragile TaxID=5857 RepID=A0A0D9QT09_PLAFR|nr:uncharacterized protein AK88_00257 [Plasmodium fragile]KJP90088.1 hypothetical protein AK88_00257 [Plasmodium fragile]